MKLVDGDIRLSASDLSNHLGCRHLTWLDLRVASGQIEAPEHHDPRLETLRERGFQHEAAYLEHLECRGRTITRLADADDITTGFEHTVAAMRDGANAIVQATLTSDHWLGYADVLLRIDTPSDLGNWSYEVVDTKLVRETRAGTILQLSLYSGIVGELQGRLPDQMHVVSPGRDFEPESHRVLDYAAYYRHVRRRLEDAVAEIPRGDDEPCYPEPVAQCDICRWWAHCRDRRRADDHLSLVASISRLQIRELEERGTATVEELAEIDVPIPWKPRRGSRVGLQNVREQARVQIAGRRSGEPVHELLPLEPDRGFARLPAPSPGDIFFDIEGGRFVGEHGLEYLLAFVHRDGGNGGDGSGVTPPNHHNGLAYEHRWAFDAAGERQAFAWLVDTIMDRWAADPTMHIYHYAPYEPVALKRLMGRYATREDEVDRMLRGGLFVDLFHVVRQTLRASVESYSLKELESFYGFERSVDLRDAGQALRRVEHLLELGEAIDPDHDDIATVLGYNRDDCISTLHLRDWLERLRAAHEEASGEPIARPAPSAGEPSDAVDERQQRVNAMKARLMEGVPPDPYQRDAAEQARALLAEMLDFHRRESKAPWWEYFRLLELTDLELLDEKAAIAGLELVERVGGTKKCPIDRYAYPRQDTDIGRTDELHLVTGTAFGKVEDIDRAARHIDVKKKGACKDLHPTAFFAHSVVGAQVLADSLLRFAGRIAGHGLDRRDAYAAAAELFLRSPPRLVDAAPLNREGESPLEQALRVIMQLDDSHLPIQGPPGAGKTFTGAHMITELVRAGKKVGVTAVSHKVIRNLLDNVIEVSDGAIACGHKVGQGKAGDPEETLVTEFTNNEAPLEALTNGQISVLGGTAWLWAREEFERSVDVLFADEAGQMALANVLAVAPAARSLVLLGDPQQLEQPQQGSHPEGTDVSALEHILGDHETMPADRGLFLPATWRLHPSICGFTSEVFYEGRLTSVADLAQQTVDCPPIQGSGLWLLPVEHSGNQSSSIEEAATVERLVADLLAGDPTWVNQDGATQPLTLSDILIVAPYNAQVSAIAERIPGARVGTVDKFQGQEAPIVIYSLTTSSPEDAPRGMEFLYSPNRLNVATSRPRCCCILVASPLLFAAECKSPAQMKLANGFCRYAELGSEFPLLVAKW